jgi:hypothetical protein
MMIKLFPMKNLEYVDVINYLYMENKYLLMKNLNDYYISYY